MINKIVYHNVGDAILHLIPHALLYNLHKHGNVPNHHDEHEHDHTEFHEHSDHHDSHDHFDKIDGHELHQNAVWLGLVVMVSLVGFFSFERIINKLGEWREKGNKEKVKSKKAHIDSHRNSVDKAGDRKPINAEDGILNNIVEEKLAGALDSVVHGELNREAKKVKVIRSGHRPNFDMVVGERVCKHRYSSICVDDIDELMNTTTPNGHDKTDDTILTKANNNDNLCHGKSFKKKLQAVKDKVPEPLESQSDIKDTVVMSDEFQTNCDNSSLDKQHLDSIKENTEVMERDLKKSNGLDLNLTEQLIKAKQIIMNGSPTKKALSSEVLLGKFSSYLMFDSNNTI